MAKYRIEKCSDYNQWDDFVNKSPQGTIFSDRRLISAVSDKCDYYFVKKGEEVVGAINIMLDKNGEPLFDIPFMQYSNAILFKDNFNLLNHKRISEEFKITEVILNELVPIYKKLQIINAPFFHDMRPFQWYNYHTPEYGIFDIHLWYTPILSLQESEGNINLNLRTLRKREINKKENYHIDDTNNVEILNKLHKLTFERQNIERSNIEERMLINITNKALDNGFGRLSVCSINGEPSSAYLFLFDDKRGYYLFGANHPKYRKSGSSTKLMLYNILYAKKEKLKEVDFVGANSPNRGDYKISFNANILPYFSSTIVLNEK